MKKLIISLLLVTVISVQGYCLSRGEIRSLIRQTLNDTHRISNIQRYSNTFLNQQINNVQKEIVRYTNCISSTYYITTSSDVQEYNLPGNYLESERVSYHISSTTNTFKKLEYVKQTGLDTDNSNWENYSSGLPSKYYIVIRGNVRKIGFYFKPSSTYAGTNYAKLEFYCEADDMDSDNDIPFNGLTHLYTFHNLIVTGVMSKFDKGYIQEYQIGLNAMDNTLANKPDWKPSFKFKFE